MKGLIFSRKIFYITITLFLIGLITFTISHGNHGHKKDCNHNSKTQTLEKQTSCSAHGHNHTKSKFFIKFNFKNILESKNSYLEFYMNKFFEFLEKNLADLPKINQAYIGAFIVSSASIPVFLVIMIFNFKNIIILDALSAFSAGALVGDVFLHNIPEIYDSHSEKKYESESFFLQKETLIGLGLITLFAIEKIIKLLCNQNKKEKGDNFFLFYFCKEFNFF